MSERYQEFQSLLKGNAEAVETLLATLLSGTVAADEIARPERLLAAMRRAAPWFRARVSERAGLRYAPEIRFEIDRTFDEADKIGALLRRPDVARDIKDD